MDQSRSLLKALGSLWLAVVLLMLLLVAMASATAYESTHGLEQAQAFFYKARWFQLLLGLLGLNVLAALLVRLPFNRRQVGFVVTHVSILLILAGAWVTEKWGIDGQVAVQEGQTASAFQVQRECVTISYLDSPHKVETDLAPSITQATASVDLPVPPTLVIDDLRAAIERYLPDSETVNRVVDDNPQEQTAVEVAIAAAGEEMKHWVFPEDSSDNLGSVTIRLHQFDDKVKLDQALNRPPASQPTSMGTVAIEHLGETYEFPLEQCIDRPVKVDNTGYSLHVLRYLPHAIVGEDRQLKSASSQPVNPAIEAEITGPEGTRRQLAFARFPDFQSMHSTQQGQPLKLRFTTTTQAAPPAPLEIYAARTGELGIRFNPEDGKQQVREISEGQKIDTPWPGITFAITRRFNHARVEHTVQPIQPARSEATPAVYVAVTTPRDTEWYWLRKGESRTLTVDSGSYRLSFANRTRPLGFNLLLNRFEVITYPGTQRPRSFESHVTLVDPATGRRQSQVISMNRPAKHGGYTLYQSSYQENKSGRSISVLSVAWDPGQPVVFVGYIGMLLGMIWVVGLRMIDRRRNRMAVCEASIQPEDRVGT